MDPHRNPFSPDAGTQPPELAGREGIVTGAKIALGRTIRQRSAQSQILLGLRGTGKTVLLNVILNMAEEEGYLASFIEAPENKTLAEMLFPRMRQVLRQLSAKEAARALANQALSGLRNFASVFNVKIGEIEIGVEPNPGVADSGDLESDLADLFVLIGNAAKAAGRGWALIIDEMQYLSEAELAAIIVAQHKINQRGLPVVTFAAGLPQIAKLAGDAKSYAERLYAYPPVGALDTSAAENAIRAPIEREGESIEQPALDLIIRETGGYPFFLQEWSYQAWHAANESPITLNHAREGAVRALQRLDEGFFKVRMDRLTPAEVDYVMAMAGLGQGPYRSGDVAAALGKDQSQLAMRRTKIIKKGMIYSPRHGDLDFTVPLFDEFLRRRER